jgi:hypothetical protein
MRLHEIWLYKDGRLYELWFNKCGGLLYNVHELWNNYFGQLHEQQRVLNNYRGPGFSLLYILAPLSPLPLSCLQVVFLSHTVKKGKIDKLVLQCRLPVCRWSSLLVLKQ